jgi:hypothetical protein
LARREVVVKRRAAGGRPDGQLLHIKANTSQSTNWFSYNLGSLERGGTLFTSITGDWTVPTVSQHTRGQDEYSSDWIGIGGGCVDAACGPSIDIPSMTVYPGDRMHASLAELVAGSNVWTITLQDVTRNETFTQTVPYTSTHLTAEWIEETPLLLDPANPCLAALPNLTTPAFNNATVNGRSPIPVASEEIQLIDGSGNVIGAPSAPDPHRNGFNACTWAASCTAPTAG